MPLINGSLAKLITGRPQLLPEHRPKVEEWFKSALGKSAHRIFTMQADMVNEICLAEHTIQSLTPVVDAARAELSEAVASKDIARIQRAQAGITAANEPIEHWRQYWHCIKLVGDTVAARFVDVDYFKAFSLAQAPGYLSGKDGLEAEMKAAVRFANEGYFVIVNDLTNCLKGGDLTLINEGKTEFVEVKSNPREYQSRDTRRRSYRPL